MEEKTLSELKELVGENATEKDVEKYNKIVAKVTNKKRYSLIAWKLKSYLLFKYFFLTFGYTDDTPKLYHQSEEYDTWNEIKKSFFSGDIKKLSDYKDKLSEKIFKLYLKELKKEMYRNGINDKALMKLYGTCFLDKFEIDEMRYLPSSKTVNWLLDNGYATKVEDYQKLFNRICFNFYTHKTRGVIEILELLLKRGADINIKTNFMYKDNTLYYFIFHTRRMRDTILYLVGCGGDIYSKNTRNESFVSELKYIENSYRCNGNIEDDKYDETDYSGDNNRLADNYLKLYNEVIEIYEKRNKIIKKEISKYLIKDLMNIVITYN